MGQNPRRKIDALTLRVGKTRCAKRGGDAALRAGLLIAFGCIATTAFAQRLTTAEVVDRVGIDQKLGVHVPPELRLRDESGRPVRMADFYGERPIVLNLVYLRCPMLCNMTMDGLTRSLKTLPLEIGEDFTVLTVSFDPREGPGLAAQAKKTALRRYERPGAEQGWRFLTGDKESLEKLTGAVGFRYAYDQDREQYAHAAALVILTPEGKVSRYLTGVEFPATDLRLSLVEASDGKIGSTLDRAILLCFHYDPATGKYGLAILRLVRILGVATVLALATMVLVFLRREQRARRPAEELEKATA
jgi:protein SCO1/2